MEKLSNQPREVAPPLTLEPEKLMKKPTRTGGLLAGESAGYVLERRMDISNYIEVFNQPPPVMYSRQELLLDWIEDNELTWSSMKSLNSNEAIWVQKNHGNWHYNNIWVRASNNRYRNVLKEHARHYRLSSLDLETIDADHVVNRARLANHPDARVMLFPVHWESNRPFGSRIERQLEPLATNIDSLGMEPIVLLKVLSAKLPTRQSEMDRCIADVLAQINCSNQLARKFWADMFKEAIEESFPELAN